MNFGILPGQGVRDKTITSENAQVDRFSRSWIDRAGPFLDRSDLPNPLAERCRPLRYGDPEVGLREPHCQRKGESETNALSGPVVDMTRATG